MLKFVMMMVIPLWACIYTIQFGRWVGKKQNAVGAMAAYVIAVMVFCGSGWVFWRANH